MFHVLLEIEKEFKERVYKVEVYRNELSYAIVKLPIVASNVKKATIKVDTRFETTSISRKEQEELEKFLYTFFRIYPKANAEELKYYGTTLLPIQQPLAFEELSNLQVAKKRVDMRFIVIFCIKIKKRTFGLPCTMKCL
ncbi:conjugal transfer protein [Enterococcus faecium]